MMPITTNSSNGPISPENLVLTPKQIEVIGHTIGLERVSDEIGTLISQHLTKRLETLLKISKQFQKSSKRKVLSCGDINSALASVKCEKLFGYSDYSEKGLEFKRVERAPGLFYIKDSEIRIEDCLKDIKFPRVPLGPKVSAHWLAIEGVQPKVPQNPLTTVVEAREKLARAATDYKDGIKVTLDGKNEVDFKTKKLVKHVLSLELRKYYEKITDTVKVIGPEANPHVLQASLKSLREDCSLQQLVPYFTQFIADEVSRNLTNLPLLLNLIEMAKALLLNTHLQIELYLQQLIPSVMTCIVGKQLCKDPETENHWKLRDNAADLLAHIVRRYGIAYESLKSRITRTLMLALLSPKNPRTTQYGALVGVCAMGAQTVHTLLIQPAKNSNLKLIASLLQNDLQSDNAHVRTEATMCYKALSLAACTYLAYLSQFFKPELVEEIQKLDIQEPPKSFKHRLESLGLPDDIDEVYNELFELFGESILPYIHNDVSQSRSGLLAMDVFI